MKLVQVEYQEDYDVQHLQLKVNTIRKALGHIKGVIFIYVAFACLILKFFII